MPRRKRWRYAVPARGLLEHRREEVLFVGLPPSRVQKLGGAQGGSGEEQGLASEAAQRVPRTPEARQDADPLLHPVGAVQHADVPARRPRQVLDSGRGRETLEIASATGSFACKVVIARCGSATENLEILLSNWARLLFHAPTGRTIAGVMRGRRREKCDECNKRS